MRKNRGVGSGSGETDRDCGIRVHEDDAEYKPQISQFSALDGSQQSQNLRLTRRGAGGVAEDGHRRHRGREELC